MPSVIYVAEFATAVTFRIHYFHGIFIEIKSKAASVCLIK